MAVDLFEKEHYYSSERNIQILIALLKEYHISKVIVSPGALNASFAYSIQQDGFFEIYSVADERSASYMACGLAEESGEVVAISCTGATASRNYLSALTEAYYRGIPILAITSGRERSQIGHNVPQAIDRTKIQNDVAKISVELPIVKNAEDERTCEVLANKAINELWHHGKGPVHIDLISRMPDDFSVKQLPHVHTIRRLERWNIKKFPKIERDRNVAIFCGAHSKWNKDLLEKVDYFCKVYNAKIICDHTSNYQGKYRFPLFVTENRNLQDLKFDLLIHIGNVSGAYYPVQSKETWRVHPNGEFCDTFKSLKFVFEMQEDAFFDLYTDQNQEDECISGEAPCPQIGNGLKDTLPFSNVWIASITASKLPSNAVLHLGILNSLRSWNLFPVTKGIDVYANTGGFGIDGCLSALIGASLADQEKIYYGVLGDLAFFDDMNVLGNRHIGSNLRILLINNGGAAEFNLYSNKTHMFGAETESYISASGHYGDRSHSLVKEYVESLGFIYKSAKSKEEFLALLPEFINAEQSKSSMIIEAFTDYESESEALRMIDGYKDSELSDKNEKVDMPKWVKKGDEYEIVLWGCGNGFQKNLSQIEQFGRVRFVCDNNEKYWNKEIVPGIRCIDPNRLQEIDHSFVVITVENKDAIIDIIHQILGLGIHYFDTVSKFVQYAKEIRYK